MRVALCFSGQIRSFEKSKENLEKFILSNNENELQIDVFLHTYYKYGDFEYRNYYSQNDPLDFYGNYKDIDFSKIITFFKPISFKFESPHYEQNSKSMFYSMYKCNELKREYEELYKFKYDIVVKLRYDFYPTGKINYEVGDELHIIDRPGGLGGLCEAFSYSSSETMDKYTSIFKEYENEDIIENLCPETLNEIHIKTNNLRIKFVDKTFLNIIRKNGIILHL